MNKRIPRAVICDNSQKDSIRTAAELKESGIYAVTCEADSDKLFRSVTSDFPDVLVMELIIGSSDAVSFIRRLKEYTDAVPYFIVISDMKNSFIERSLMEGGADLIITKPYTTEQIAEAILKFMNRKTTILKDPEMLVTELIQQAGIPANIRGYRYVRTAILECIKERNNIGSITKELYPIVAEKHNTNPACVERAIRRAIDCAWERFGSEAVISALGYEYTSYNSRPTNSEFIACAADKTALRLKAMNYHGEYND